MKISKRQHSIVTLSRMVPHEQSERRSQNWLGFPFSSMKQNSTRNFGNKLQKLNRIFHQTSRSLFLLKFFPCQRPFCMRKGNFWQPNLVGPVLVNFIFIIFNFSKLDTIFGIENSDQTRFSPLSGLFCCEYIYSFSNEAIGKSWFRLTLTFSLAVRTNSNQSCGTEPANKTGFKLEIATIRTTVQKHGSNS